MTKVTEEQPTDAHALVMAIEYFEASIVTNITTTECPIVTTDGIHEIIERKFAIVD